MQRQYRIVSVQHSWLIRSLDVMWLPTEFAYRKLQCTARLGVIAIDSLFDGYLLLGSNYHEANRWITIPVINQAFQPSDWQVEPMIAGIAGVLGQTSK